MDPEGFSIETSKVPPKTLARRMLPEDLEGKRILLVREGGIGDTINLLPICRWLKDREPTVTVMVGCNKRYKCIPQSCIDVDYWYEWAPKLDNLNVDGVVSFKGVIEVNPKASYLHAVDCHYDWIGIDFTKIPVKYKRPRIEADKSADYRIRALLRNKEIEKYKGLVVLQLRASSPLRTWPESYNKILAKMLVKEGLAVALVDSNSLISFEGIGIFNFTGRLSILDFIALCANADLCVGPDSGISHIAGALSVPFVGYYASFLADLRLRYYRKSHFIQGSDWGCSPCFFHRADMCKFSLSLNTTPCMRAIKPKQVYELIKIVLHNDCGVS